MGCWKLLFFHYLINYSMDPGSMFEIALFYVMFTDHSNSTKYFLLTKISPSILVWLKNTLIETEYKFEK
jgi:hypothetical protein